VTVQEWAARYLSLGWGVVPLAPRKKSPTAHNWNKIKFQASDLKDGDNIGIAHGTNLLVSDCDSRETTALADLFLPPTATYGRPSALRAKRVYEGSLPRGLKWRGSDGHVILELRAREQDMAPPSTHPDGEVLAWDGEIRASSPSVDALLRAHRLLATAALVAAHYPPPGARHDWTLAVSGVLRKLGLPFEEADSVISEASRLAGEPLLSDRKTEIHSTYTRSDDFHIAGFERLRELSGPELVSALQKIWDDGEEPGDIEEQVTALNARHAVLFQQSGDLIVLTEDPGGNLRFSQPSVIKTLYPKPVRVGKRVRRLGDVWLEHPKRRYYSGIELAPNGYQTEGYYNLWKGFSVEPKKGDWSLFREHISLMSEENPDLEAYLLAWLADAVQHPERPGGVGVALVGGQGTGKSTMCRWFGALFGHHFLHVDSDQRLLGRFNAQLHNAVLVFADEAVWAGGKQGLGAFKRLVTEDTITIERKGIDPITVRNLTHLLMASNEEHAVPVGRGDRRFAVFHPSDRRRNDHRFFGAVHDQLFKNGGLEGLLYDLLEWRTEVRIAAIPETAERAAQRVHTMGTKTTWWQDVLNSDLIRHRDQRCASSTLYQNYLEFAKDIRAYQVDSRTAIGMFLRKVAPSLGKVQVCDAGGTRNWAYQSPGREVLRREFEAYAGGGTWEDDPDSGEL